MTQIYTAYAPRSAESPYIQEAFAHAGLILNDRNLDRYSQLLREQRHIPLSSNTYGYRGPHQGRHIFLIVDEHKLIVGGAECVPVLWRGVSTGESHVLVRDLVVLPNYRQQKVATNLLLGTTMRLSAEDIRLRSRSAPFVKMRAIIPAGQRNAIHLFQRCGWELVENTEELYEYSPL